MPDKLAVLMKFENPFQAETVRIGLNELGVKAFVENAESTRAMHYVGTALGGVKVLVPESQLARAKELLKSVIGEAEVSTSTPWICAVCGEEVEASFDICWSCGGERSADAAAAPPPRIGEPEDDQDL
jgi:hypothetical protein